MRLDIVTTELEQVLIFVELSEPVQFKDAKKFVSNSSRSTLLLLLPTTKGEKKCIGLTSDSSVFTLLKKMSL